MTVAISADEREAIVRGYRDEIEHYVAEGEGLRALALMFDFIDEFCPNFEDRVLKFSEQSQSLFLRERPDAAQLQVFQSQAMDLLDTIVAFVLPPRPPALEGEVLVAEAPAPTPTPLIELKKRVLTRSENERDTLVSLSGASRTMGRGKNAFSLGPVTLDVGRGEVIGLVGHNGSGKTTLLRLLAAEIAPSGGQVKFPGLVKKAQDEDRIRLRGWRRVRARVAFVTPKPDVINEKVIHALQLTAAAYGAPPLEVIDRANVSLHRFGLSEHRTKRASALSTGLRLRFEIARILLTDPDLIILDEPLANLDVVAQQNLLSDLQVLAASVQRPRAIVISSQHIGEIEAISDRVIVLSNGAPLFVGYKDEISAKLGVSVFELVAEDKRALVSAARKLNPIEVIEMGISSVLIFPGGVQKDGLLAHMSASGVNITGFNDLSNSAKALLYLDKLLAEGRVGQRARTP